MYTRNIEIHECSRILNKNEIRVYLKNKFFLGFYQVFLGAFLNKWIFGNPIINMRCL